MNRIKTVSVVIPTYNRPVALARCLKPLLQAPIDEIIVVDDSTTEIKDTNKSFIESANNGFHPRVKHITHKGRTSEPIARNKGIRATEGDIVLLLDDDMVLTSNYVFKTLKIAFELHPEVGIICGRIVEVGQRTVDPPFYLNIWLADFLSKITGFVFLNVGSSIRFAEYGTHVMMVKREAFNGVHYDERFVGTHYREETDFQQQCKRRGWKILFLPTLCVVHHGASHGGSRGQDLKERMYWKARNHLIYLKKNFKHVRRYWYFINGLLILFCYSPTSIRAILKGFRDGQVNV
jgi:glycosyltransferase involved in cell wall biosynthesis